MKIGCKNYLHRNAANARKNVGKKNDWEIHEQKDEEHSCYPKINANQLFRPAILTYETYKSDTN